MEKKWPQTLWIVRHGQSAGTVARDAAEAGGLHWSTSPGESWCDVILRLRSFLDMLAREHRGDRVLVVAHQVIVNCMRYLLERLDESEILAIDRLGDVPNCGITSYEFDPHAGRRDKLVLRLENFVSPLRKAGAPVTAEPDRPAAAKS